MNKAKIPEQIGTLSNEDFTLFANQPGFKTIIMSHSIPSGKVYRIPKEFMGCKLQTKHRASFTTGAGETTQTITLPHAIAPDPLLSLVGEVVTVVRRTPTPVEKWTSFTVTEPTTVNLTGLIENTAYVFDIYYRFGTGSVKIMVESGDQRAEDKILEESIRSINIMNQEDVRTGLKPGVVDIPLTQDFRIYLEVKTLAPVILYGETETDFSSPFAENSYLELPINMSDMKDWGEDIQAVAKARLAGF